MHGTSIVSTSFEKYLSDDSVILKYSKTMTAAMIDLNISQTSPALSVKSLNYTLTVKNMNSWIQFRYSRRWLIIFPFAYLMPMLYTVCIAYIIYLILTINHYCVTRLSYFYLRFNLKYILSKFGRHPLLTRGVLIAPRLNK